MRIIIWVVNLQKNIKMKIVFVCILKLIFISSASSQSVEPCHVCEYGGTNAALKIDVPFFISDIPKRCKIVTYGFYEFDGVGMDDIHMIKKDEIAIQSMVAAGIPVYTYVSYNGTEKWCELFDPNDQTEYDKIVGPLIQKLNELQLTGIIFNIIDLYNGDPDFAINMKGFVTKLKIQIPNLKFGMNINGKDDHEKILNNQLFDYSVSNSVIDLYFVDMHTHDFECTSDILCYGTPITSTDKKVISLEVITNAISQSAMDKSKILACIYIAPLTEYSCGDYNYNPYSQYCGDFNATRPKKWCLDKSQKLYDIGAFVKKSFAGVAVDWLEWDDVQCQCECGKFPVTNMIFDGWDGVPINPCPKIG